MGISGRRLIMACVAPATAVLLCGAGGARQLNEALRWAVGELAGPTVAADEVRFDPDGTSASWPGGELSLQLLAPADDASAEAFATSIDTSGERVRYTVRAGSDAGLLYGVLDLAGGSSPTGLDSPHAPSLTYRCEVGGFPFWGGNTLYDGHWKGFAENDRKTSGWWWYDKARWTDDFRRLARGRVNGIVWFHAHPYTLLLPFDRNFKDARWLAPEEHAEFAEQARWIMRTGRQYNVRVYIITWNILIPPGLQAAFDMAEFGEDNELTRGYTRHCVRRTLELYPDLGGLGCMVGEAPVGCADFVAHTMAGGLADAGARAPLLLFTWCSYPPEAKRIMDAYPGPSLAIHYLQYETFFAPRADPRIGMWSAELGDRPMISLGGAKGCNFHQFWAHPEMVRGALGDLHANQNGHGAIVDYYGDTGNWLNRAIWRAYMWDPHSAEEDDRWERFASSHFSSDEVGGPILRAARAASSVMPRFVHLVHSQTDHYFPETGIPLVNYIEMPTVQTYVFENHTGISPEGWLEGHMGLTWPNPDWGVRVWSVRESCRREITGTLDDTDGPTHVADDLERWADVVEAAVAKLSALRGSVTNNARDYDKTLALLPVNVALGRHHAARIRAAVAWERMKAGRHTEDDVLGHLDMGLSAWRALCEHTAGEDYLAHCAGPRNAWRSCVSARPPWDHNDIWTSYRMERVDEGNVWQSYLPFLQAERNLIARRLSERGADAVLPLEPEVREFMRVAQ